MPILTDHAACAAAAAASTDFARTCLSPVLIQAAR